MLLTRDQGLLKRSIVEHGYWVRSSDPEQQLFELCKRFDLGKQAAPFTRCVTCNGALADVQKKDLKRRTCWSSFCRGRASARSISDSVPRVARSSGAARTTIGCVV